MLTAVFSLDVLSSFTTLPPEPVLEVPVESRVSIEWDLFGSSRVEEPSLLFVSFLGDDSDKNGERLKGLRGVGGTTTSAGDSIDA